MKPAMTWFRLRFPRDLDEDAVLAALAALSGDARMGLVFQVRADTHGVEHHIGVDGAPELVAAELRAAIPSLHFEPVEHAGSDGRHRLLWQLVPAVSALRTDGLAAIAASLLASFYPVMQGDSVCLTWTLRPAAAPPLVLTPDDQRQGRAKALRDKLKLPGFTGYGELCASGDLHRVRSLMRQTSSVLYSLSSPFGRLAGEPPLWGQTARLLGLRGRFFNVREVAAVIGWPIGSPELPGLRLGAAKRLLPAAELPRQGRVLGISNFAGVNRPVALSPTASTRGLYLLGPTGSGKTALIKNVVRDDMEQGRGVAVVETNGDLIQDLLALVPERRLGDVVVFDPTDPEYAVGFNPFDSSADSDLVADQLIELFSRLWKAYWGPRTAQIAHMVFLSLARRPGSTLLDAPRLLTDEQFRTSVVGGLDDPLGLEPDWSWYAGLPQAERESVTAPLRNKLRQFTARPAIRASIGQTASVTMSQVMVERKIFLAHLPKGLIGTDTASLLGCLVLTALWQAATERARLPLSQREPFSLYVDEWQDFSAAPVPWDEMAAQGRKYGLALTLAHQSLAQLPHNLLEIVLANARSKAVFALSASDARTLERLFAPALSAADLLALDAYTVAALVALDDGSVARPVTLSTPSPPEPTIDPERVRDASRRQYARPRAEVEAALRRQLTPGLPAGPLGSKRRRP